MKKITLIFMCLVIATGAFSQILTKLQADSIAIVGNVAMKTQASKYKYYQPTQTIIGSLIDASTVALTTQFNNQSYLQPPIITSAYKSIAPINLQNASNQTISGDSIIGGKTPCITLTNCHGIHITLCKLINSSTVGIYLINCYNITIDYNFITNVSTGVYVENSSGGGIVVNYNQFKNMNGPLPRGQFVQFNTVSGPGLSISYNRGENIIGSSHPEDAINLYMTNGTSVSPIQIVGNNIRGGGPSTSGGGIMLGDNGGSYQYAANNILVNPGQYGMAISGGDHNSIVNNQIFALKQSFTNVGVYVWGQGGYKITNSTVSGNLVNWINSNGVANPDWLAPNEITPVGWNTNNWKATISAGILPASIITAK